MTIDDVVCSAILNLLGRGGEIGVYRGSEPAFPSAPLELNLS